MPQSKRTTMIKHCAAMQLILAMQDSATGEMVNVKFLQDPKNAQPPTRAPEPVEELQRGLANMQDLLMLMDPDVYAAYVEILTRGFNVPGAALSAADAADVAAKFSQILRGVTETHSPSHVVRSTIAPVSVHYA